jgi:hypothetical protein
MAGVNRRGGDLSVPPRTAADDRATEATQAKPGREWSVEWARSSQQITG